MKRVGLLMTVLVISVCMKLPAQRAYPIDRGSLIVGGTAGFTSTRNQNLYDDDRLTIFTMNAKILYFVRPHLAVGGDLRLDHTSLGDEVTTLFSLGPSLGYFLGNVRSEAYPFVIATLRFGSLSQEYSETIFSLSSGAIFMIVRNVGFSTEGFIQFESYQFKERISFPESPRDDSATGTTLGALWGLTLFFF